mmetsp:Transcript_33272/g.67138  ORF Transcript_33272/g.67138 Transcript_33272/m.67138 type:complete len:83 (+) Transcript_33272:1291-1539(+)
MIGSLAHAGHFESALDRPILTACDAHGRLRVTPRRPRSSSDITEFRAHVTSRRCVSSPWCERSRPPRQRAGGDQEQRADETR